MFKRIDSEKLVSDLIKAAKETLPRGVRADAWYNGEKKTITIRYKSECSWDYPVEIVDQASQEGLKDIVQDGPECMCLDEYGGDYDLLKETRAAAESARDAIKSFVRKLPK